MTSLGEHILDELLIRLAESSADMEDEIIRASMRFTIFAIVSVVAIGQVALWVFPADALAQDNYGPIANSSSTGIPHRTSIPIANPDLAQL